MPLPHRLLLWIGGVFMAQPSRTVSRSSFATEVGSLQAAFFIIGS
jgi:hypothetical protein